MNYATRLLIGGCRDGEAVTIEANREIYEAFCREPLGLVEYASPDVAQPISKTVYRKFQISAGKKTFIVMRQEDLEPEEVIQSLIKNYNP